MLRYRVSALQRLKLTVTIAHVRFCATTAADDDVAYASIGRQRKTDRLLREALAIATPSKYRLSDVLENVHLLQKEHQLEPVLTFPKPRRDGGGGIEATKLIVPFEIIVFRHGDSSNYLAVLSDGTMVAFGLWQDTVDTIRQTLKPFEDKTDPCAWGDVEVLQRVRFTTMDDLPALGFEKPADVDSSYIDEGDLDAIVLEDDGLLSVIPFVYCLSRRVQIEACSTALKPLAAEVAKWRRQIRETGSLPVTVKQCRARKANTMRLFAAQSRIALRPRIFSHHDYNGLRHIYGLACEHFELSERSEALRTRIESAAQSLSYMGGEANHKTNHRLEVVICVLIFTEIIIHLFDLAPHH